MEAVGSSETPESFTDTTSLFLDFVHRLIFNEALRFKSRFCLRLQAKKRLTWRTLQIEMFSVTGHHRNTAVFKMCPCFYGTQ